VIWYLVGATLGVVYLGFCVWFIFEVITAPLVDEDGTVISDPHHRMSRRRRPNWHLRRRSSAPEVPDAVPAPPDREHVVG
jgi:hypothetical protein